MELVLHQESILSRDDCRSCSIISNFSPLECSVESSAYKSHLTRALFKSSGRSLIYIYKVGLVQGLSPEAHHILDVRYLSVYS